MKKLITLIAVTILLTSCGNDCPPPVECNDASLQAQITELQKELKNKPNEQQIIRDYLSEQKKKSENKLVSMFWEIDLGSVEMDTITRLQPHSILNILNAGGDITYLGYLAKDVWEQSSYLAGKLQKPENLDNLYSSNKKLIKKLTSYSSTLQDIYRDAGNIAQFFDGSISSKKQNAHEAYFSIHDGEPISLGYKLDPEELEEDTTRKNLIAAYDGNQMQAYEDYLLFLSAKRQKARFGEKWMKTAAKILRDFGEIE